MTEERKQYIAQYAAKCEQDGNFPADQLYFWSLDDRLRFIDYFLQSDATVRSRWWCGIQCLYDLCKQSLIPVGKVPKTALGGHTFGGYCSGRVWQYHFSIAPEEPRLFGDSGASERIKLNSDGKVAVGNGKRYEVHSVEEVATADAGNAGWTTKWKGGNDWIVVTADGLVSFGNKRGVRTFPVKQLIEQLMGCEGRW